MILIIKKVVEIDAKELRVHAKVYDNLCGISYDQDLIFNMDLETGQILNCETPTAEQLEQFMQEE